MQYLLIIVTLSGAFQIERVHDDKPACIEHLKSQVHNKTRTGWMCKPFKYEPRKK